MAQTGYTPLQLYYSDVAGNTPSTSDLMEGELAINTADGILFYKDNTNALQVIGTKKTLYDLITTSIYATPPVASTQFYVTSGDIDYYTADSTVDFSINIKASPSDPLNIILPIGGTVVAQVKVTNGATPHIPVLITVDSAPPAKLLWQGGSAPVSGTPNGVDTYTFTIIKTANTTFTVFASVVSSS